MLDHSDDPYLDVRTAYRARHERTWRHTRDVVMEIGWTPTIVGIATVILWAALRWPHVFTGS